MIEIVRKVDDWIVGIYNMLIDSECLVKLANNRDDVIKVAEECYRKFVYQ